MVADNKRAPTRGAPTGRDDGTTGRGDGTTGRDDGAGRRDDGTGRRDGATRRRDESQIKTKNMNKYNPKIHHRRSIRLKGYDYSQAGLYFITICVQNRACLFGEIKNGQMILNDAGKMMEAEWLNLKDRFPNIELNEFVTMPNHFHGILQIVGANDGGGQPQGIAPTIAPTGEPTTAPTGEPSAKTIGDMMDAFKSITTVAYIRGVKTLGWQPFDGKLLQRNYYEHIIRDEKAYHNISNYIINNPAKWAEDTFYG